MYFVTSRTFQARMLLTPSREVNEVLSGCLARAASVTGVEIHGFVAMSNHVHLLVTAKGASLSSFMQAFLGNASKKVGRLVKWSGSFWQGRFSAIPVLDDAAAEDRLRYILAHGVKEGLVGHPREWPGMSCLKLLREGGVTLHKFFHWARRWKHGAVVKDSGDAWDEKWAEEVELRVSPLPGWVGISENARRARVDAILDDIVSTRDATQAKVLGASSVVREEPHRRPLRCKRSVRPVCHASDAATRQQFRETLAAWVALFREASVRLRGGDWGVKFPPWSFRPSAFQGQTWGSAYPESMQLAA